MTRRIPARFLPRRARLRTKGTKRGPRFKSQEMTQPERDFFVRVLTPMLAAGIIDSVRFQALTFQSGQGSSYTPDFTARRCGDNTRLSYEVKGDYVYEDSIIKFKGCVLLWPDWTWFWCQRNSDGEWSVIRASQSSTLKIQQQPTDQDTKAPTIPLDKPGDNTL